MMNGERKMITSEIEIKYKLDSKIAESKIKPICNLVKVQFADKTPEKVVALTKEYLTQLMSYLELAKPVTIVLEKNKDDSLDLEIKSEDVQDKIYVNRNKYYLYNMILGLFFIESNSGKNRERTETKYYHSAVGATISFLRRVELQERMKLKKLIPPEVRDRMM